MQSEKAIDNKDPELKNEAAGDICGVQIELQVAMVDAKIIKLEQSFYFIAEPDETTGSFHLSIPYDEIKQLLASGMLTGRSQIVKFSLPL